MLSLLNLRLLGVAAICIAMWFLYGWGMQIIETYNANIAKIASLERTQALLNSRLDSRQLIIDRYKAAVEQSQCRTRIEYLLRNPDLLKKVDPFNPSTGG